MFCHIKINTSVPINKVFLENSLTLLCIFSAAAFTLQQEGLCIVQSANASPEQQNGLGPQALLKEIRICPLNPLISSGLSQMLGFYSLIPQSQSVGRGWEGRKGCYLQCYFKILLSSLNEQTKQPDLQLHHLPSL